MSAFLTTTPEAQRTQMRRTVKVLGEQKSKATRMSRYRPFMQNQSAQHEAARARIHAITIAPSESIETRHFMTSHAESNTHYQLGKKSSQKQEFRLETGSASSFHSCVLSRLPWVMLCTQNHPALLQTEADSANSEAHPAVQFKNRLSTRRLRNAEGTSGSYCVIPLRRLHFPVKFLPQFCYLQSWFHRYQ